jgi:hypothetical protein
LGSFAVVDGALHEKIAVLGTDNLIVEPFRLRQQGFVYVEYGLDTDTVQGPVEPVLNEFVDHILRKEIEFAFLEYPIYDPALCRKGFPAHLLNQGVIIDIEPIGIFILDYFNNIDTEIAVDLFFLRGGLYNVRNALQHVLVLIEGHDDQKLRKQGNMLDKEGKK